MENNCCLVCQKIIEGRMDKKYCSLKCKSKHHYIQNKQDGASIYNRIDRAIRQNRRILKEYAKAGKASVKKSNLIKEGFNPDYFTHFWKAKNGNFYLFCYEYGFMEKPENGNPTYFFIQWKDDMDV